MNDLAWHYTLNHDTLNHDTLNHDTLNHDTLNHDTLDLDESTANHVLSAASIAAPIDGFAVGSPQEPKSETKNDPVGNQPPPPMPTRVLRSRPPVPQWVLVALVLFGIGAELTRRTAFGVFGVAITIAALLLARFATGTKDGSSWSRSVAAAIGIGAALGMLWRSTPTLLTLDVCTILLAIPFASSVSFRSVTLLIRTAVITLVRPFEGFFDTIAEASSVVLRGIRSVIGTKGRSINTEKTGRVVVGLIIALPVVLVLGLLLGSADAVFASFFTLPDVDLSSLQGAMFTVGRVLLFACALGAPIFSGARLATESREKTTFSSKSSPVEVLVVLGAVNVLFGLFAIAQLATIAGAGKHVLETSGLTYAEYARSGFFQLLAVSVLTLMIIGVARSAAGENALSHTGLRWLSASTAALTIGITAVAANRLSLYMRAYGLTVDRIVSQAGTITVGIVFALLFFGIVRSRPGQDLRGITTSASIGVAALAVFALHAINPSAWSVRDGLTRGGVVSVDNSGFVRADDRGYTHVSMNDDAATEYAKAAKSTPELRKAICGRPRTERSWFEWTVSSWRADRAIAEVCNG